MNLKYSNRDTIQKTENLQKGGVNIVEIYDEAGKYFFESAGNICEKFNSFCEEKGIVLSYEDACEILDIYHSLENTPPDELEYFLKYLKDQETK